MASNEVVVAEPQAATEDEIVPVEPPSPNPSNAPKAPISQRLRQSFHLNGVNSPGKGGPNSPNGGPGIIARLSQALSASISSLMTPRKTANFDEADIPQVWLDSCHGNRRKAFAKWDADRKWRIEHQMDKVLDRPYIKYEAIKKSYPQVVQGRGVNNEIFSLEVPAKLDLAGLRLNQVTAEDMGMHIAIGFEYLFKIADPSPDAKCCTIMDLKSLSLTTAVSLDNMAIMRATAEAVEQHYPGRLKKIYIINPPFMFSSIFGVIKAALPPTVRDAMEILSNVKDLHKHIKPDQLPKAYGGTGPEFGQSPMELEGREFFLARLQQANAAS